MDSSPRAAPGSLHNQLLEALPRQERDRLLQGARRQSMDIRHVLFESNQTLESVHFPLSGMISLVTPMQDGTFVEMGTVGREGIVGVPMVLDSRRTANAQAVSQVEGESLVVTAGVFRREFDRGGRLSELTHSFVQALFSLVGQNAACNRLHTMHQRCARWLLMTHDRVGADEFHLTHEFLSQMLGSRRASVTEAAAGLKQAGAISYHRGNLRILDRRALEAEAR